MLPEYFSSDNTEFNIVPNSVHNNNTRQGNSLHILRTNHKFADKCIRFSVPKTINDTPNNIKEKVNSHSLQGFSKYIKIMYLQKYSDTCNIHNCYICNKTHS